MDNPLREIYQQVILDHNKSPQNFRVIENPTNYSEGFNPLCGDHIHIYMNIVDGKVEDISFQGNGCAISKSSASIMTTIIKGKSREDAEKYFQKFHDMVTGVETTPEEEESLGKLLVFQGVREFPARVKCASLAWHTMHSAIEGKETTISTE
ncbi:MAG: SUF system NifU family Fe-S cluster assembly protein [Ignavibacteriaceae bacterium]|nr:SUF system NifU family Fe-S cluster assembly protein [Ignavibacteriaceae bacterium]